MKSIRLDSLWVYRISLAVYIIGGTVATVLSVMKGLNREHIGIAFLLGSILPIAAIHMFKPPADQQTPAHNRYLIRTTTTIWLFVFLFSIIPLLDSYAEYSLSLTYFLSICVMTLIISYQILAKNTLTKPEIYIILAEIVALALYLSASLIFLFPALIGADSYFHVAYASSIINTGNIGNYNANFYVNYPVYHLTIAVIMLLSGINSQIVQLVLALIQMFAILLVFAIGYRLFNEKIALLSALLISLSSQMIIPRYTYFPSDYSIVFFILLLFILFCLPKKGSLKWPLALFVLIVINLLHPLFSVVVAFTLASLYILSRLIGSTDILDLRYVVTSILFVCIQYIRPIPKRENFIMTLQSFWDTIVGGRTSITQATLSPYYSWIDVVLYELGFTLLILFGICGAMLVLRMYRSSGTGENTVMDKRIVLSAMTLIVIPIPYVLALISPDVLPDRWFIFITIFIGLFSAEALYLFTNLSRKLVPVVLVLIQLVIFFSIASPTSNPNAQIFSENLSLRPAVTQSELSAAHLFSSTMNLPQIEANSLYLVAIDDQLNIYDNCLDPNAESFHQNFLIIRNYDLDKGFVKPLFGNEGKLMDIIRPSANFTAFTSDINKLYENGEVRAYQDLR